jgi:ribonucleotide reductase beta subunit family protein with ferritin-like domain
VTQTHQPSDRGGTVAGRTRPGAANIDRLLHEMDALIDADDSADRRLTGAWKSFDDINAAASAHAWDAYSVDLTTDAASYLRLDRRDQQALLRLFGTIYRAEAVVDDWMDRIVAAIPTSGEGTDGPMGFHAMRTALMTQEHDEKMHRGSLRRIAQEVLRIRPDEIERIARSANNFVAETLFARFDRQMAGLLRPGRPIDDVYVAIFVYGVLSEDVVANSDVVIRRAKENSKYDEYDLPGMKQGQTNVRRDEGRHVRIAVLATHKFLAEHGDAAASRLVAVCGEYLDLADTMLRQAKASHGLIDAHLSESYGNDVDSLYYYVMNMKRLAARLDELGLADGVREVKRRVDVAVSEFTDADGHPVIDEPNRLLRTFGPTLLRFNAPRLD